jgi:hypothetical protein
LTAGELGAFVTAEWQRQAHLSDGRQIPYARGLFLLTYQGLREVAHPGATAGYRAWLGRYPDAQVSIALLCNAGDAPSVSLAHAAAGLFLTQPMGHPGEPEVQPLSELARRTQRPRVRPDIPPRTGPS